MEGVVNADDFGRSHSINQAVIRAHREGILTTASLMVNEEGFDEAVTLVRQNPELGLGLQCFPVPLPPTTSNPLSDATVRDLWLLNTDHCSWLWDGLERGDGGVGREG